MGRTKLILEKLERMDHLLRHLGAEVNRIADEVVELKCARKRADNQLDRMADRLVEMTLIQKGKEREAVAMRRLPPEPVTDDWGNTLEENGDEWHPAP